MTEIGIDQAVDYVLEHHPHAWQWDDGVVRKWVGVFAYEDLLMCTTGDGRTINGLIMFRPVMNPEDAMSDYCLDPEGACVFIDFCCGYTEEIRRGLLVALIYRVGTRPLFAWERYGTLRIYNSSRLVQHILKEEEKRSHG